MSPELPEPEGEGWDAEVRITKRDLHGLLNQHGAVVRAELRAAVEALDERTKVAGTGVPLGPILAAAHNAYLRVLRLLEPPR